MPNFTISPTTGEGGYYPTEVAVTPTAQNLTSGDLRTILTVSGGGNVQTATITQWGIPSIVRNGSGTVPATGDTLSYTIHTHYPFCFKDVPGYVTITDSNGNSYSPNTQYEAALSEGVTFFIAVGNNPSATTRNSGTFYMGHYYDNALSTTYTAPIYFEQAASTGEDYLNVTPSAYAFDWDDSGTTRATITVDASRQWSASLTSGAYYEIVGTGAETVTIVTKDENQTSSSLKEDTLVVTDGTITKTVSLRQLRRPRFVCNDDGGTLSVNPTGETMSFTLTSDYNWYFNPPLTVYIFGEYQGSPYTLPTSLEQEGPSPSGKTFTLTWSANTGNIRNDSLNVDYVRLNGTTGSAYRNFSNAQQMYIEVPRISVSPSGMVFDWWEETGDTQSFSVSTNQSSWDYSVSHNLQDFTFVKDGNYLRVTPVITHTSTNFGVAQRYATITFSAGTATTTVTVTQLRKPSVNAPTGVDKGIPASGGTREVVITSDYNWWLTTEFATNSYLTVEKSGEEVDIFDYENPYGPVSNESFDFIWEQNLTNDNRPANGQGCFYVRYNDRSGNLRTDGGSSCGWRQSASTEPAPYLIITTTPSTGMTFNSAGTASIGKKLEVSASTDWVVTSKPDWMILSESPLLTRVVTGGTSGNTPMYPKPVENSGASRSGIVTVSGGGLTASSATITQEQGAPPAPAWNADPTDFEELPSWASDTLEVAITAATVWTIQKEGDFDGEWIHILSPSSSGSAGESTLQFYIEANNSGAPRSGLIKIISPTESNAVKLIIYVDQLYP